MRKKTWVIAAIAVVVVAVGAVTVANAMSAGLSTNVVNYTVLKPTDLVSSVSAKGTVESNEKSNVYSTLNFPVKSVDVKVGDVVAMGQTLCVLDTDELERSIAQQRAELEISRKSGENTLENNQRVLTETEQNMKRGTSSALASAKSTLDTAEANFTTQRKTAEQSLADAQKAYDDALADQQTRNTLTVQSARNTLEAAQADLNIKTNAYGDAIRKYDSGESKIEELRQAESSYIAALSKLNESVLSLQKAEDALDDAVEQAENALTNARISYDNTLQTTQTNLDNAERSYAAARTAAQQELERSKNTVTGSEISVNTESKEIAIEKLEKQFKDATITSPAAGTVTAVYAKEGASGSGLLFVIEDVNDLKIVTRIKEYDVERVKVGMPVEIKSDATGDTLFEGEIGKIDPAAIKNQTGETAASGDIEFGAEVQVLSKDTPLRIGLSARLTVLLDQQAGVLCVPYDAIIEFPDGSKAIYAVQDEADGKTVAKQMAVTTGAETDFYVEIAGPGVVEGLRVVSDASQVSDGMRITVR